MLGDLREGVKRRWVFRYLKRQELDVCLLQETHGTKEVESIWSNEWGNRVLYSNGTCQSQGVAILLGKKVSNNIRLVERDMEGCMLKCQIIYNEYTYNIINVYGPNCDDDKFFNELVQNVKRDEAIHTIVGGDFNVVRDPFADRGSGIVFHPRAKRVLDNFLAEEDFADIWRNFNPDKKWFTWMKLHARHTWSRIDYFLVSPSLLTRCTNCEIIANTASDHSLVSLDIDPATPKRGPGVWKLNDEMLQDNTFCEYLNQYLSELIEIYSYMDPIERWELLKVEVRRVCHEWSKLKAANRRTEIFGLYQKLSRIQETLMNANENQVNYT